MKILFLGQIGLGQTSLMRMRAFERLRHTVRGVHTVEPWSRAPWLKRQVQRRLQRGSVVDERGTAKPYEKHICGYIRRFSRNWTRFPWNRRLVRFEVLAIVSARIDGELSGSRWRSVYH